MTLNRFLTGREELQGENKKKNQKILTRSADICVKAERAISKCVCFYAHIISVLLGDHTSTPGEEKLLLDSTQEPCHGFMQTHNTTRVSQSETTAHKHTQLAAFTFVKPL